MIFSTTLTIFDNIKQRMMASPTLSNSLRIIAVVHVLIDDQKPMNLSAMPSMIFSSSLLKEPSD